MRFHWLRLYPPPPFNKPARWEKDCTYLAYDHFNCGRLYVQLCSYAVMQLMHVHYTTAVQSKKRVSQFFVFFRFLYQSKELRLNYMMIERTFLIATILSLYLNKTHLRWQCVCFGGEQCNTKTRESLDLRWNRCILPSQLRICREKARKSWLTLFEQRCPYIVVLS